jgi:hypothetical protein
LYIVKGKDEVLKGKTKGRRGTIQAQRDHRQEVI